MSCVLWTAACTVIFSAEDACFLAEGAIGMAEERWLRFQAIHHNNAQVGAMKDTTFLCLCCYCQDIGVG
jgi:hypothetical protein